MRIIRGRFRGRRLASFQGKSIRPLRDSVRESIFNILGPDLPELRVLDLFCGSGSFGLEALSRGAASCTFVELDRYATSVLQENLEKLGLSKEEALVCRRDVFAHVRDSRAEPADLVFLDPPYPLVTDGRGRSRLRGLFEVSGLPSRVVAGGLCLLHTEAGVWSGGYGEFFEPESERAYGRSEIHFLRRRPGQDHLDALERDL